MNSLHPSVASSATRRPYSRPKLSVEERSSVEADLRESMGDSKTRPARSMDAKSAPQK